MRHLIVAIRKSDMCKCGCKGWCTLFTAFWFLRFQAEFLGRGTFPDSRHDHEPWRDSDRWREMAAGMILGFIGVCLFIKADWAELSVTLGLPTWADNLSPCPCCLTPNVKDLLFAVTTWTPHVLPFDEATEADYLEACQKCEIWVVIENFEQWRKLRCALIYMIKSRRGCEDWC